VFETCAASGIPVAVFLAGGYARELSDTVGIQSDMVEESIRTAGSSRSEPA
jgi:hypothetical protein